MKRYLFKRHQRKPFARKMLLAGIAGCTVVMANTLSVDFPELALTGKGATAATSPVPVEREPSPAAKTDVYLTTGFLDGLLVDRSYDDGQKRAAHIPEIADELLISCARHPC